MNDNATEVAAARRGAMPFVDWRFRRRNTPNELRVTQMSSAVSILNSLPWFAWIAIVAIVCGSISDMVKRSIRHRERMAMIQHGMHPDSPTAKTRVYEDAEV
jgi:hypothetical protein